MSFETVLRLCLLMHPWHSLQGCGIVEFESPGDAQAAISQLNESEVSGLAVPHCLCTLASQRHCSSSQAPAAAVACVGWQAACAAERAAAATPQQVLTAASRHSNSVWSTLTCHQRRMCVTSPAAGSLRTEHALAMPLGTDPRD